jgi:hypothetical protein
MFGFPGIAHAGCTHFMPVLWRILRDLEQFFRREKHLYLGKYYQHRPVTSIFLAQKPSFLQTSEHLLSDFCGLPELVQL